MNNFRKRLKNQNAIPKGLPGNAAFPEDAETRYNVPEETEQQSAAIPERDTSNRYIYEESRLEQVSPQLAELGYTLPEDPNDPSFLEIIDELRQQNPALATATLGTRHDTFLDDNEITIQAQEQALKEGQLLRRLRAPFMTRNAAGREEFNKQAAMIGGISILALLGFGMTMYNPHPKPKTTISTPTIVGSPVSNADGSQTITYSDGSVVTNYPDGTTITVDKNGIKTTKAPDGTLTTEYPDGRKVITKTDKTSIEYTTDHRIITRDAQGRVIQTTAAPLTDIPANPNTNTPTNTITTTTTPGITPDNPATDHITTSTPTQTVQPVGPSTDSSSPYAISSPESSSGNTSSDPYTSSNTTTTPKSSNSNTSSDPYANSDPSYTSNTSTDSTSSSSTPTGNTTATSPNTDSTPTTTTSGVSENDGMSLSKPASTTASNENNTGSNQTTPNSYDSANYPTQTTGTTSASTSQASGVPHSAADQPGTTLSNLPATGVNSVGQHIDQNGQPTSNTISRATPNTTNLGSAASQTAEHITVMKSGQGNQANGSTGNSNSSNANSTTSQSSSNSQGNSQNSGNTGATLTNGYRQSMTPTLTVIHAASLSQNSGNSGNNSNSNSQNQGTMVVYRKADPANTIQRTNASAQATNTAAQATANDQTSDQNPYAAAQDTTNAPANTTENSLAGITPTTTPSPYKTGQRMNAKLVTGIFVAQGGSTLPVYAQTGDGTLWRGEVTFDATKRIIVVFDHATLNTGEEIDVQSAAYHLDGTPGIPAKYHDISPTLANDLIRASLSGVKDYVDAKIQATTTTTTSSGSTVVQRDAPSIGQSVAASASGVFTLPSNQNTFVTVAEIPVNTPFVLIYGNVKLNNKN